MKRIEKAAGIAQREEHEYPPSLDFIEKLISENAFQAEAFLQAVISIQSDEMLYATWRILLGLDIRSIVMSYECLSRFELTVNLSNDSGTTEKYKSESIFDLTFLQHLGTSTVGKKPFIDGFFALKSIG